MKYHFDAKAAAKTERFFELYLTHIKGEWSGRPFVLEPWQKEIVHPLFGWKRPDGTRRYRTCYIEIPRKNGKSSLCAGLALYLLMADREPSAEVYSAAADREQASIIFDIAKNMVALSPELSVRLKMFRKVIAYDKALSSYKTLSADAYTKHGLNAHGIIFDELHAQPNRELWDVLATSTGARTQPLTVAITTAGFDRNSICWEMHEYARRIKEGVIEDDSFLPVIYAADEQDDWRSPAVWRKANPNLGVSISEDYLKRECDKAGNIPAYENTFRRLYLNQWTQQESRWIPMSAWELCGGAVIADMLKGKPCYAGLDLSSTTDITALVLAFPIDGAVKLLPFFWIPADNLHERSNHDHVPYELWVKQGLINATAGNVIDYGFIVAKITELRKQYVLKEIAFDRWGAAKIVQELEELGVTVVPFGQGFASMSGPSKELLRLVLAGKLHHGGNPVMRWMADNAVVKSDPSGNIKPDKSKSTNRIDGIVAAVMALDRAMRHGAGLSVYENRGVVIL
ncbi:MAG: terminase large subunit [Elusimicrobiales bacterium]|nr:terminase large subunit [Elusimicrobiales bacterium]